MRWLCLLLVLAGPVSAQPAGVWYQHKVMGGPESADWLCLRQEGAQVSGYWLFYQVGPKGQKDLEVRPVSVKAGAGRWQVSTCYWDGDLAVGQRFVVFEGAPVRLGQSSLYLVNEQLSTGATNYRFTRTAAPLFFSREKALVRDRSRLMRHRLERMKSR
jgi:hypothetical protein